MRKFVRRLRREIDAIAGRVEPERVGRGDGRHNAGKIGRQLACSIGRMRLHHGLLVDLIAELTRGETCSHATTSSLAADTARLSAFGSSIGNEGRTPLL